ncbi:leucine-rich repeat domain-containing protein [Bacteroides propionicifaciens]|uniref:leucine-rich repeat domain-containing protein n=1 Tax=Bacteroides propionicifaciens TaxID=392838 RepID=UPI000376283D|nr:leucine-rich repeat domain-containing protein [Bacteroides propionicifaciens]
MDKHTIHNNSNTSLELLSIPRGCTYLNITGHLPDVGWKSPYTYYQKLYLFMDFFDSIRKVEIEILDMSRYENVEVFSDSFKNLPDLKVIILPTSLKMMPKFENCPNLIRVSGANIEFIDEYCFVKCRNLIHIDFGANIKHIRAFAFAGSGITHITIPDNNVHIYEHAFQNCHYLRTITLPNDIDTLKSYVFFNCFNLLTINGGKSINKIYPTTFQGCSNLRHLELFSDEINESHFRLQDHELSSIGIVIVSTNEFVIIWDICSYRFYYSDIDSNAYNDKIVRFQIVEEINMHSNENKEITLSHRYKAKDITIVNTEEELPYLEDNKKCAMLYYLKQLHMHNIPIQETIFNTTNYVDSLDIQEVINNYRTSIHENIITKVGGDDRYYQEIDRRTIISDAYIDSLLPPLHSTFRDSGYTTFSYMSSEERNRIEEEDENTKQNASKTYDRVKHIDTIVDDYISTLIKANIYIETYLHLREARQIAKHNCFSKNAEKVVINLNEIYRFRSGS